MYTDVAPELIDFLVPGCAHRTPRARGCVDKTMNNPVKKEPDNAVDGSESVIEEAERLHGSPVKRSTKRVRPKGDVAPKRRKVGKTVKGKAAEVKGEAAEVKGEAVGVEREAAGAEGEATVDSVALQTRYPVGRFWTTERITNLKHHCLLRELDGFFTDDLLRRYLLPLLSPKEGGTGEISRRVMDWFVVNYAKKWPVMYRHETKPGWVEEVNVCRNYELRMKQYGKHSLDVFCRNKQRVHFELDGKVLTTVVAQLNFVRWAIRYGVFDRLLEMYDAVRADHHENMAKSRAARKEALASGCHKKRASLSIANPVQSLLRDEPLEVRYV